MQIVSIGDNLHKMSNSVSGKNKKNIINLSSAEFAQKKVKVNLDQPISYPSYLSGTGVDPSSRIYLIDFLLRNISIISIIDVN